jgi:protein required for attachment to host cells
MKAKTTWIVIADGARARIAINDGIGKGLKPALDYEFAAPHAPSGRMISDRPGRQADPGGGASHGVEPRLDRHDYEKVLFARDIAAALEEAAHRKAFDRLVLVAPPAALGRLRAALSSNLRQQVAAEISKDLTHLPLHKVGDHLNDAIAL